MDYEKLYKEALERAKELSKTTTGANYEYIFPELKESEDERIRKSIIAILNNYVDNSNTFKPKMLAWLEKQGEQKPHEYTLEQAAGIFLDALSNTPYNNKPITDAQVITKELLKFLEDTSSYNPNAINEQAPADKVEPKFHEGDWVIDNNGKVAIIYDLQNAGYVGHYTNGTDFVCKYDNEHLLHLWTINDATEGDVLIASDNSVFIYAGSADRYAKFYAALTKYSALNLEGGNWEDKNRVHPATKEQRDTLEKAMAEAGYTFDFDKKELRKIEPNLSNSAKIEKDDTLLDLLQKIPSYITVDGIFYHFMLRKTSLSYMAFYEGEGEGGGKIIFWMTGDPIELLTAMLDKLKEEGLLDD